MWWGNRSEHSYILLKCQVFHSSFVKICWQRISNTAFRIHPKFWCIFTGLSSPLLSLSSSYALVHSFLTLPWCHPSSWSCMEESWNVSIVATEIIVFKSSSSWQKKKSVLHLFRHVFVVSLHALWAMIGWFFFFFVCVCVCFVSWQKGMKSCPTFYKVMCKRYFPFSVFHCKNLANPEDLPSALPVGMLMPRPSPPCMPSVVLPACFSLAPCSWACKVWTCCSLHHGFLLFSWPFWFLIPPPTPPPNSV